MEFKEIRWNFRKSGGISGNQVEFKEFRRILPFCVDFFLWNSFVSLIFFFFFCADFIVFLC